MRLPKPEVAGQRRGLGADAFLEIAVGADDVNPVLNGLERVVGVEARRHHLRGDAHADAVRESLAERTGGDFDAGRVAVLGMAGGLRAPLPKTLELLDRHLRIAGEMQQRIEQHRGVAGGEDEAIAILPRAAPSDRGA